MAPDTRASLIKGAITDGVREVADLLSQTQTDQVDAKLDKAASTLLVAVADGLALIVEAAGEYLAGLEDDT